MRVGTVPVAESSGKAEQNGHIASFGRFRFYYRANSRFQAGTLDDCRLEQALRSSGYAIKVTCEKLAELRRACSSLQIYRSCSTFQNQFRTFQIRRLFRIMQTILVTGGAGFLGSHLCERLLDRGDEVICVDNFFTGSKRNVAHLVAHPRFELIRHDIVHPLTVEVSQIYNLACPASPVAYQYNPIKTIKTSSVGVVNMLGLAKRCRARFLQASTSEVYGDPQVHPQTEDYWGHVNPLGPRSCYDEGKRIAESLCVNYTLAHGVETRLIRIFNTYGPRMDPNDGRVISNFITQALRGEPLTVYGDGSQTRSFCYRDDLIEGMIRLMNHPDNELGPVNIGNPNEKTMLELAEAVLAATGSSSKVEHRELPKDDPTRRCPNIDKAKANLGWQPEIDLATGLERTVAYYRELLTEQAG
jgi:UDP-glucuronate decarboxylase